MRRVEEEEYYFNNDDDEKTIIALKMALQQDLKPRCKSITVLMANI